METSGEGDEEYQHEQSSISNSRLGRERFRHGFVEHREVKIEDRIMSNIAEYAFWRRESERKL